MGRLQHADQERDDHNAQPRTGKPAQAAAAALPHIGPGLPALSPTYVREMTDSAKHINPRIKFYPLMYFQDPWADFLNNYAGLIDGVVIAYPR